MNTRNSKTTDEAKIRTLIDERANALRNKDAGGVISHHAEDFVQFSLAPPLIATDANVKGFEAWFATWQGQLGYELRDLTISVGDGIAFSHSLNHMTGTKTDGQKADLWFRQTLCFLRSMAPGPSCMSMNPCRSTWTAASARRST